MMEDYLQTEWPDLNVWLTSTTEQWAVVAVNGPNARKLLEPFVEGLDISAEAFPHMSVAECRVAGFPARLFRISFTGELGFEVNVPARHGRALWETLFEAGKQYDICPYGTETMHALRAEKGYIIVGQDTDGTVTPDDAGLGWAVGKKKPDFIGMRALRRPDLVAEGRKQLVGLLTTDGETKLEEGAQIVFDPNQPIPMTMVGHVTSSYGELGRQQDQIELIASENIVSRAVLEAQGSVLTNKYAEGYPGRRYYGGCEYVDVAERLAIERACALFGCAYANVQPHSGAQANQAVLLALLQPGDTILGMSLAAGGHLTHGAPPNLSGKWFNAVTYGVRRDDALIDFDELERLAREHKPRLIIAGGSAYPRQIDFAGSGPSPTGRRLPDGGHGAFRRTGRAGCTPARCRTPMSSPARRTRRCGARAAA
jgi:hypothetical protein